MSRFVALHVSYLLQPPSLLVSLCFFIFFVKWKWPFLSSTATSNYLKKAVLLLFFLCPSFLGQKQLLLCWYSYCIANFNQCGMISFPPPNSIFFWTCSPKLVTDVLCNIQSWSSAAATVGLKEQRFGLTHKRTERLSVSGSSSSGINCFRLHFDVTRCPAEGILSVLLLLGVLNPPLYSKSKEGALY